MVTIDEKKLLDNMFPLLNSHGDMYFAGRVVGLVNSQPKTDGWIACEDRLPEDGVDVLVWYEYFRYGEYNRLFQTTGISFTYNGEWSGFVNGSSGWNQLSILAWQPLPEPYKPGGTR